MLFGRKEAPLDVQIPGPAADRAITTKVGIIAGVGFVLGVLWPRLLHVHVGPNPPEPQERVVTEAAASNSADPSGAAPSASEGPVEAPKVSNKEVVVVGAGEVVNCVTKKGDHLKDCGTFKLDSHVTPKLKSLAECPAAIGLEGDMPVGLNLNFEKSSVDVVEGTKKSTLPLVTVRGILKCVGDQLKGWEIDKIPHTQSRYLMNYKLSFYPPGKGPDDDQGASAEPSGSAAAEEGSLGKATVVWEKALVRESPKDGKVVARLPQGSRVKLLATKDGWYQIVSGPTKGWVHRDAIGK